MTYVRLFGDVRVLSSFPSCHHGNQASFSKRLKPLGLSVRELTGDMSLTKAEITATQMLMVRALLLPAPPIPPWARGVQRTCSCLPPRGAALISAGVAENRRVLCFGEH